MTDKNSIRQETTAAGMFFLQVPGTEHGSESSRGYSASSSLRSGSIHSRIHFKTTVRMLAPVIWSRIQSKKKVCLFMIDSWYLLTDFLITVRGFAMENRSYLLYCITDCFLSCVYWLRHVPLRATCKFKIQALTSRRRRIYLIHV